MHHIYLCFIFPAVTAAAPPYSSVSTVPLSVTAVMELAATRSLESAPTVRPSSHPSMFNICVLEICMSPVPDVYAGGRTAVLAGVLVPLLLVLLAVLCCCLCCGGGPIDAKDRCVAHSPLSTLCLIVEAMAEHDWTTLNWIRLEIECTWIFYFLSVWDVELKKISAMLFSSRATLANGGFSVRMKYHVYSVLANISAALPCISNWSSGLPRVTGQCDNTVYFNRVTHVI